MQCGGVWRSSAIRVVCDRLLSLYPSLSVNDTPGSCAVLQSGDVGSHVS
jgi:hypothetical protein